MTDRCVRDRQDETRKGLGAGAAGSRPVLALVLNFQTS